jgi:hypothetical protein
VQESNAAGYQNQLAMTQEGQRRTWAQQDAQIQQQQHADAAKQAFTIAQYMTQVKTPEEFKRLAQKLGQNPLIAQHLQQQGASWESITPNDVPELLSELGSEAGVAPPPQYEQVAGPRGSVMQRGPGGKLEQVVGPDNSQPSSGPAAPSGYRPTAGGGLEPIPGGPADPTGPAARRVAAPLRKEFRTLESVKAFETALPLIKSAEKAPDTGYGDLQLIYTAGKVLDPGSVVREGELALAIAAGSPLQRLIGKVRFTTENGGRLPPKTRAQIMDMLNQRVSAYQQAYEQDRNTYAQYAQESGVDANTIIGKHPLDAYKTKPAGQAQSTAPAAAPVKVSTPAEAAKLPSGTQFITPDGQVRVKR